MDEKEWRRPDQGNGADLREPTQDDCTTGSPGGGTCLFDMLPPLKREWLVGRLRAYAASEGVLDG